MCGELSQGKGSLLLFFLIEKRQNSWHIEVLFSRALLRTVPSGMAWQSKGYKPVIVTKQAMVDQRLSNHGGARTRSARHGAAKQRESLVVII